MLKHMGVKTCRGEVVLLFPNSADGVTQEFEGVLTNKCLKVYVGLFVLFWLFWNNFPWATISIECTVQSLILLKVLVKELNLGKPLHSSPIH